MINNIQNVKGSEKVISTMRMSQDEKAKSYERIVENASRRFRQRGLDGTSVADVMNDAGMTHGGFYKHFESKDALIMRALDDAFSETIAELDRGDPHQAFASYKAIYLSHDHIAERSKGCPVAALGSEIARGSAELRVAFGAGVRRLINSISRLKRGSAKSRRDAALREFSMMAGAIIIARASDPEFALEVLAACRKEPHNDR